MINFKELILMLMPTFLRCGVLKAWLMAVATSLQRCFISFYDYINLTKTVIQWTSERKAMRERLNLLFLGKSYDDNNPNEYILVEDGYDIMYPIMWNNEEFETDAEAFGKAIILADTAIFKDAFISWGYEDLGVGCDIKLVVPEVMVELINIASLKKESNRLIFAGLLCKFYSRKIIGNNNIDTEI